MELESIDYSLSKHEKQRMYTMKLNNYNYIFTFKSTLDLIPWEKLAMGLNSSIDIDKNITTMRRSPSITRHLLCLSFYINTFI